MRMKLHHGDCREVMSQMEESSVDSIVTDPPYELRFMGKHWDSSGVAFNPDTWREAFRVLKPGGHLLAFGGTRTFHRIAVAIEDAGFQIRDVVSWVYGSGFPKSHNLDGEWKGWGTALKPAWEPIIVARKPLDGTVAENVRVHGTGAMNIDGCRVETWPKTRSYAPGQRQPGGKGDTQGTGEVPSGRWPANFIHDGSEEVVGLFPETVSGKPCGKRGGTSGQTGVYGSDECQEGSELTGFGDSGSAARFFYCAKASKSDRDEGLEGFEVRSSEHDSGGIGRKCSVDRRLDEGGVNAAMRRNIHPTVKPTALMRYLVRLVTPPGGIVLDPFMGSGSTGKAAILEGLQFMGIEREVEYLKIAQARISHAEKAESIESTEG